MSNIREWETGSSSIFAGLDYEGYKNADISSIELSYTLDGYKKLDFFNKAAEYGEKAASYGLTIWSLHLPFSGQLDVSSVDDDIRSETIRVHSSLIEAASAAGVKKIVVHPSAEPIADDVRARKLELSRQSLLTLSEHCERYGVQLAVEDLPRTCLGHHSDEFEYLLEGNPAAGICFDTNHLLIQDNTEFVKRMGARIVTLHVSDYDFIDERHLIPFEGKNDWRSIICALMDAGYNGPLMYEVPSRGRLSFDDLRSTHMKLAELCER